EAVAQRVGVGTAREVGDAGVGQIAAKPHVYGRLVDRPARGDAVEHVVAALGGGVRGRYVGVEGRSEPTGDWDGPALAVLRVTDPQRRGARVHVGKGQVECLRDPQPGSVQHPEESRIDQRLVRV